MRGVALSSDGRYAILPELDRELWDLQAGKALPESHPAAKRFFCDVRCNPSDNPAAIRALVPEEASATTVSRSGTRVAWIEEVPEADDTFSKIAVVAELPSGKRLASFPLLYGTVTRLILSHSGRFLAGIGVFDHFAGIWDVDGERNTRAAGGSINDVAFVGDRALATSSDNGELELIRARDGKTIAAARVPRTGDAYIVTPTGRYKALGTPKTLRCRVGHHLLPFEACAERLATRSPLGELPPRTSSQR